ncbi:MAG: ATP-binding protein [Lacipirellulaceae bacterium]
MSRPAHRKRESIAGAPSPLSRALAASGVGLWDWRLHDDELWGDAAFGRLTGLGDADATWPAALWLERVHAEDGAALRQQLDDAIADGGAFDTLVRVRASVDHQHAEQYEQRRVFGRAVASRGRITHLAGGVIDAGGCEALPSPSLVDGRPADGHYAQAQPLEVDGLAVGVAHEFNNVLQIVIGYVGFAATSLPAESEERRDLAQALAAADRATQLTRRLVEFAHAKDDDELLDLREAIHGFSQLLRPIVGENVHARCAVPAEPMIVRGGDASLRLAILNLCVNARDAMPEGGELLVRAERVRVPAADPLLPGLAPGEYCRVWVTDTGCGMPPHVAAKAFDPFFTTKGGAKGAGLGLSIVKSTMQRLGGAATLHSVPGLGTSVALWAPLADPSLPETPAHANDPPPTVRGCAIVVGTPQAVLTQSMRALGWRVEAVANLEAACASMVERATPIDALVVDAEELHAAPFPLPWEGETPVIDRPIVIATTAFDPESTPTARITQRADSVVAAPLLSAELPLVRRRKRTVRTQSLVEAPLISAPVATPPPKRDWDDELLVQSGLISASHGRLA